MISVIIPAYNHGKKLPKCLDSILAQIYKNIEVIVVNDGSRDNTEEVLETYSQRFNEEDVFLMVINQENGGAPRARNAGFQKSNGEYLFFCDADAILRPEALETMLHALDEHTEASYVYSSFLWGKKLFKLEPFSKSKLKKEPYIHTMSLIRREDFPVNGWDESIKKFQDWDIWLTMLASNHIGHWIDEVLFTVSTGGTMSSWLPAFAYKTFPFLPSVKKYKKAMFAIKTKHNL